MVADGTFAFDTPDGRYYKTPYGEFPSVTTLLKHCPLPEKRRVLEAWAAKMRREGKDPDEYMKHCGIRGDLMHKRIEAYLLSRIIFPFTQIELDYGIPGFWDSVKPKVVRLPPPLFMEQPVYNPVHGYAGRMDLTYEHSRYGNVLRDWKTAEYWRKEEWVDDYKEQCCAYAIGARYTLGLTINRIEIVVCFPNGAKLQQFVVEQDHIPYYYDRFCRKIEEYQAKSKVWPRYAKKRIQSRFTKARKANTSSRRPARPKTRKRRISTKTNGRATRRPRRTTGSTKGTKRGRRPPMD